ncbi:cyclic-di-AMP receptor [Anaerosalibacter sp. Marseille-P3206]|uniref:cyclic-di-AMP receptor n=1 Tax=Anaerosalibacter sp. Marseille-P3206 TaxID=1871005 RepID=UPI000986E3CF|nr:cyclic-di-AMP receptor [Anaerosalibacter sp. Marseille-P3206]
MKLLIAIVQDADTQKLVKELMSKKYRVTKLASTGGFLKAGNTTLLIGVEEEKVEEVISTIEGICKSREAKQGVNVGGATVFVMDIDKFKRV